jgi:flavin-dependent dehydrogenase
VSAPLDVLVLGAGPAGAATALQVARAGARVAVLERERFPRRKVCGEFLSPEGCAVLERLGLRDTIVDLGAHPIDRFRLTDLRGRSIESPLPDLGPHGRQALGISRAVLDRVVLQAAAEAGADVRERVTALGPVLDDGRVVGVRAREAGRAGDHRVSARVVVAADGRRSALVRALHPELGDPATADDRSWYGLECHLAGPCPALRGAVELHVFEGGYLGLSMNEDGHLNLALVVTKGALARHGGSPDALLADGLVRNPAVRELLRGRARVDGGWKSVGPLRAAPRRPTAGGAVFVGDAAGTVDPFSGEGMSHALAAAERAAPVVLRAAASGGLTDEDARAYDRAWRDAFASITRRNRRIARLLERPRLTAAGVGLLSRAPRAWVTGVVRATRTGARRGFRR